jgi:glycosyltransferase involved in cell wall biosynthesis
LDLDRLSELKEVARAVVRIGLVGTFAKWKGHTTFLRALALLPPDLNIRAYVIGGAIYQTAGSQHTLSELRLAARECCPEVEVGFTGMVERIESAYRSLDIVVHASTKPEPFGMVIVEAMACSKPVIVSRGGGVSEIIEDGRTALSHDQGDTVMLARQLERLVRDADLRVKLGENARASVIARFQADDVGARFSELYCELVANRQVNYAGRGSEDICVA